MNIISTKKVATATAMCAAAFSIFSAGSAQAVTFFPTISAPIDGSTVIDFEQNPPFVPTLLPAPTGTSVTVGDVKATITSGVASIKPPVGSADNFLRIGSPGIFGGFLSSPGTVVFEFLKDQRFLGFDWLRPNGNETVSFFDAGGGFLNSFTAASLNVTSTRYVGFGLSDGETPWRSVAFIDPTAGINTFEVDNFSYSNVPTPALLPGLIGIGAAAWRKRRKEGESDAA